MDSQVETVRPLVETGIHQSGVNCLAVRGGLVLVTGGDDTELVTAQGVPELQKVSYSGGPRCSAHWG